MDARLFLFPGALVLLAAAPAGAQVNVRVERTGNGKVTVSAEAFLSAAPETVWETITDFDHLAQFVPALRSSRVVSPPGAPLLVEQEGVASFLWYRFPVRVTYRIEALPPRALRFRGIAGNLRDLEGEYLVEPSGRLVRLGYRTSFRTEFWLPPHIGPAIMEREYRRQFGGLLAEIERREETRETASRGRSGAGR